MVEWVGVMMVVTVTTKRAVAEFWGALRHVFERPPKKKKQRARAHLLGVGRARVAKQRVQLDANEHPQLAPRYQVQQRAQLGAVWQKAG